MGLGVDFGTEETDERWRHTSVHTGRLQIDQQIREAQFAHVVRHTHRRLYDHRQEWHTSNSGQVSGQECVR